MDTPNWDLCPRGAAHGAEIADLARRLGNVETTATRTEDKLDKRFDVISGQIDRNFQASNNALKELDKTLKNGSGQRQRAVLGFWSVLLVAAITGVCAIAAALAQAHLK